jgi:tetratricopeptide (TPR) repeat protein
LANNHDSNRRQHSDQCSAVALTQVDLTTLKRRRASAVSFFCGPPAKGRFVYDLEVMSQKSVVAFVGAMLLMSSFPCAAQTTGDRAQQIAEHERKAQQFLQEKKPDLAIPELEATVALDPTNMEVRANLGVLLFFQGRYAEAIPQLKAATDMKADLWKIRSLLGMAERRTGNDKDGRADLEAAYQHLEEEKLKIEVGRELIESYASTDDFDKASPIISTLLKLEPTNPALLYISYRIHSEMAVAAMLELGLVAPDSAQTHQAMAHELQRDRDLAGTIANLRKALALDLNLPGIHFELAEALHASDDPQVRAEAEQQYRLAVETNPRDPKAATRMGDIEVEKGDPDAAATYYRKALQLQPGFEDAAIGLANVFSEKGDQAEAVRLLKEVEAADPTNVLAHFRLSTIYRKLNRPADVAREVELYRKYKDEREKLRKIYQDMRLVAPRDSMEK